MMNKALRALCWMLFPGILVATPKLSAQTQAKSLKSDMGLTFTADRTEAVNGADQWLKGGSMELGVNAWHGLGIAARVTGVTISTVGSQPAPLNLVLVAFGPRYRWTLTAASKHSVSFYGEALIGEANGFKGLFPGQNGVDSSANAFALVTGELTRFDGA
jgi:hypothetical protein